VGVSVAFQVNTGSQQDVHLMQKFPLIVFPEKQKQNKEIAKQTLLSL